MGPPPAPATAQGGNRAGQPSGTHTSLDQVVRDADMDGRLFPVGKQHRNGAPVVAPEGIHQRGDVIAIFQVGRSEEHTSELQSLAYLVCRLLLEKKKIYDYTTLFRSRSREQTSELQSLAYLVCHLMLEKKHSW